MIELKLPSLGSDMDEGKLLEWHVKPGDALKRGQIVAVVDTSKAAVDIESWHSGTVFELIASPGETIPVGAVLATLLEPGEDAATAPRWKPVAAVAATPLAGPTPAAMRPAVVGAAYVSRPAASPAARRRARELDIAIEQVTGSGPHGAVTIEDVEKSAAARAQAPADHYALMRKAIAASMSRSKREIPHYYLAETISMRAAVDWLARENAQRPVTERMLMGALQLKAVALALKAFPEFNGFWRDGGFQPGDGIHVGVAISIRKGGLIAPAIHDVDQLSLSELMRSLSDLVKRARAGSLRSSEMSDPTCTLTNLGEQGVESVHGVIYPPQVALVGFGRVALRPCVEAGAVSAAPMVTASLAADHRVSDGHRGALFLNAIGARLQQPDSLQAKAGHP